MQKTEEEERVPAVFISSRFTRDKRKYTATEQNCLILVEVFKKFWAFVKSIKFEVVIDHALLKLLTNQFHLHGGLAI